MKEVGTNSFKLDIAFIYLHDKYCAVYLHEQCFQENLFLLQTNAEKIDL